MIRHARPSDEPALVALQTYLPEPSPELLRYGLRTTTPPRSGAVVPRFDTVLVSTAGGRVVGYLLAVGDGGGGSDAGAVHVAELVVSPDRRREGRATALLAALFDSLPAGTRVTLAVAPDNDAALALYRECGFTVVGRRDGFYERGAASVLERMIGK